MIQTDCNSNQLQRSHRIRGCLGFGDAFDEGKAMVGWGMGCDALQMEGNWKRMFVWFPTVPTFPSQGESGHCLGGTLGLFIFLGPVWYEVFTQFFFYPKNNHRKGLTCLWQVSNPCSPSPFLCLFPLSPVSKRKEEEQASPFVPSRQHLIIHSFN